MNWINTENKEIRPKHKESVLAYYKGSRFVCQYDKNIDLKGQFPFGFYGEDIYGTEEYFIPTEATYWITLPDPPKEVMKDE